MDSEPKDDLSIGHHLEDKLGASEMNEQGISEQEMFEGQTESEMLMGMESGREIEGMEAFEGEEGESMGSPDPNVHLEEI